VLEAMCWDGKTLHCNGEVLHRGDEKKTSSGTSKEPVELEKNRLKIELM
jgi:hypothetical protein